MLSRDCNTPKCTSCDRSSYTILYTHIPTFDGLIKRTAICQFVVGRMGYYSSYGLLVTLETVYDLLAIHVDQFDGEVVTRREKFDAVLAETEGSDDFVVGF